MRAAPVNHRGVVSGTGFRPLQDASRSMAGSSRRLLAYVTAGDLAPTRAARPGPRPGRAPDSDRLAGYPDVAGAAMVDRRAGYGTAL